MAVATGIQAQAGVDRADEFHTPAYWRAGEQHKVKDTTGGGNGFMGGLCAGMIAAGGDIREGECGHFYGSSLPYVCEGFDQMV